MRRHCTPWTKNPMFPFHDALQSKEQVLPGTAPALPKGAWHKDKQGWVIPRALPPVPYCWNIHLSCSMAVGLGAWWEKHVAPSTALAAIPAQLPALTWCTTSQRRGDRREGAKVQPTIRVTRGQGGGAGRRGFQSAFPQIKGVLCRSLLILSSASISKLKHFLNSCHPHPKIVRWPMYGMCSRGQHRGYMDPSYSTGQISQCFPGMAHMNTPSGLNKKWMAALLVLWRKGFNFKVPLIIIAPEIKGMHRKGSEVHLHSSEFLCLPWGCRGSSIGFPWFSWCVGCSLSLCFSIGMSPSKPFTLILFHQSGEKNQLKGS